MNWIGLFRFQMVSEIDRLCRLCIEPTSPTNLNHGILCCVQECLNLLLNERKDDFEANSEALKASVKIVSSGLHTNCYIVKLQIFLLCQSVELDNINLEPETINNTRWHFYLELIFLFSDHFHFISEEADIQRKNIISILNSSFPLNGLSVWTFLLWNRYWIKRVRCKSHSCHELSTFIFNRNHHPGLFEWNLANNQLQIDLDNEDEDFRTKSREEGFKLIAKLTDRKSRMDPYRAVYLINR